MDLSQVAERSIGLAHELTRLGARFVVVGGTARWLRGDPRRPRDLDIVVADHDLPDAAAALDALGVEATAAGMARCRTTSLATSWGPLDVFVGPAPASTLRNGLAVADV